MAKTKKEVRQNLKGMETSELEKKLLELEESIRVLRFKSEGSKSKNVKEMSLIKKNIARVLTEMNTPKVGKNNK